MSEHGASCVGFMHFTMGDVTFSDVASNVSDLSDEATFKDPN